MKKQTNLDDCEKLNAEQKATKVREYELKFQRDDDELMVNRKKLGLSNWQVKGFRFKKIISPYGEITLKRRLYSQNNSKTGKKEYVFLLDEFLDIPSYSRFFRSDLEKIKKNILAKQIYRDASNFLNLGGTNHAKTMRVYKLLKAMDKRESKNKKRKVIPKISPK